MPITVTVCVCVTTGVAEVAVIVTAPTLYAVKVPVFGSIYAVPGPAVIDQVIAGVGVMTFKLLSSAVAMNGAVVVPLTICC